MKNKFKLTFALLVIMMMLFTACSTNNDSQETDIKPADKAETKTEDKVEQKETTKETENMAKDEANVNEAGMFPIVKEQIQLTLAMGVHPKVEDVDTNQYTLYLEEKTGIDLVFEVLPFNEKLEKAMLLISSGDMPDTFVGLNFSDVTVLDYGTQGLFLPLNDLIDQYGVEMQMMWNNAEFNDDLEGTMTFADGNIYYVPKYAEHTQNTYSKRIYVYQPWLDQLGLDLPTTTDEYYNMLKAFKDNDMNGNGDPNDEIPLVGYIGSNLPGTLINAFTYESDNHLRLNDGKVEVSYTSAEYKDAIIWVNKLVNEGLLDPITFTQNQEQLKVLVTQDDMLVGSISQSGKTGILDRNIDFSRQRSEEFVPILPLASGNGAQYIHPTPANPSASYVITTQCENPAAAYRLGDLMLSYDASMAGRYGFEGVHWEKLDDVNIPGQLTEKAEYHLLEEVWGQSSHNVHWQFPQAGFLTRQAMDAKDKSENPLDYNYIQIAHSAAMMEYVPVDQVLPGKLAYSLDEMENIAILEPSIINYVNENITLFIVGDKNIDEWDTFISGLDRLQFEEYIATVQSAYDRMMK